MKTQFYTQEQLRDMVSSGQIDSNFAAAVITRSERRAKKSYDASEQGQRDICAKATSDAVVMLTNRKVRELGGTAWSDSELQTMLSAASPQLRDSLFADILNDYNALTALTCPLIQK